MELKDIQGYLLACMNKIGEGNSNPLQCSCLENLMDRGAWQAMVYGITRVGHDLATKPPPPRQHFMQGWA